jgi:hypothetical protein
MLKRKFTFFKTGDILYVPACWLHKVIAVDVSISVNCFNAFDLQPFPLPTEIVRSKHNATFLTMAATTFWIVAEVIAEYKWKCETESGRRDLARFELNALFEQRWSSLYNPAIDDKPQNNSNNVGNKTTNNMKSDKNNKNNMSRNNSANNLNNTLENTNATILNGTEIKNSTFFLTQGNWNEAWRISKSRNKVEKLWTRKTFKSINVDYIGSVLEWLDVTPASHYHLWNWIEVVLDHCATVLYKQNNATVDVFSVPKMLFASFDKKEK